MSKYFTCIHFETIIKTTTKQSTHTFCAYSMGHIVYVTGPWKVCSLHEIRSFHLLRASWPESRNTLRWRHNGNDSVSNHQPCDSFLNRLFRHRSKKTPKLRVTGLCMGNSPGTGEFPHKWPATRKMFPFDDVIMSAALVWLQNFSHLLAEIVRLIWLIMCNGHLWNTSYYVSHLSYANILTRVESPHKDLVLQNALPCQDFTILRNYPRRYSHINCNQLFQLGVLRRNQTWCWSTHVSFTHHFIKVPISFLHMCEVGHILYICHC